VKDILDIEIEVGKIETEKQFEPKIGRIDFKLDIFAESKDKRVIIEIQRIDYDYNFDRFLHYFLMAIAELQQSFQTYKIDKTVYGIVVMTAPCKVIDKMGNAVLDEVMVSKLNPKNLNGEEKCIFNHQLVFLNSFHKDDSTPTIIRDWLDLIYESIHNPKEPKINTKNKGVERAAGIIDQDKLTPEEWRERKISESRKVAKKKYEEEARKEGVKKGMEKGMEKEKIETILKSHEAGLDLETISKISGKSIAEIKNIIDE